jgi:hypothetical protein
MDPDIVMFPIHGLAVRVRRLVFEWQILNFEQAIEELRTWNLEPDLGYGPAFSTISCTSSVLRFRHKPG